MRSGGNHGHRMNGDYDRKNMEYLKKWKKKGQCAWRESGDEVSEGGRS